MDLFPTLVIAAIGTASGLTVSYALGRTSGDFLIRRYGRWLSIDAEKILRAQRWFQNLGRWVLLVGPFIPGLRNLMGYVAGASKLRLQTFATFAYAGALMSSVTFVSFGYLAVRHVNLTYARLPLIAMVVIVVMIASGAPFRLAVRLINKVGAAARTDRSVQSAQSEARSDLL